MPNVMHVKDVDRVTMIVAGQDPPVVVALHLVIVVMVARSAMTAMTGNDRQRTHI